MLQMNANAALCLLDVFLGMWFFLTWNLTEPPKRLPKYIIVCLENCQNKKTVQMSKMII